MDKIAKHIIFSGRVQGVGFRFIAHRISQRYDITGQVKNLSDGSVELIAHGQTDDIDNYLRDIEETFSGHLRDKKITDLPFDASCTEFKITF